MSGFLIAIAPRPAGPPFTGYSYDELLAYASAAKYTLELSGLDVARYRVGEAPSPRIEIALTPDAAARLSLPRRGALYDVRLDGVRCYLALGMARIDAAAVRAPVVHAEDGVLRVGSEQGAWYGWGKFQENAERVDVPALRAYFASTGALERL